MINKTSSGLTDTPGSCRGSGPSVVWLPAGWRPTGCVQDGKMAAQNPRIGMFLLFISSSLARESIDVASGLGLSFSQTTDTNWQHVPWFSNQASSPFWEKHLLPPSVGHGGDNLMGGAGGRGAGSNNQQWICTVVYSKLRFELFNLQMKLASAMILVFTTCTISDNENTKHT